MTFSCIYKKALQQEGKASYRNIHSKPCQHIKTLFHFM